MVPPKLMVTGGGVEAWSACSRSNPRAAWTVGRVLVLVDLFLGLMFGYLAYLPTNGCRAQAAVVGKALR